MSLSHQPTRLELIISTLLANSKQMSYGRYAAELSFYIVWSIVPIMLALANMIAILPIADTTIIRYVQLALPKEVEEVLLPIFLSYLKVIDANVFSLALLLALWPASKLFNTIQRLLNTIYKVKPKQNFIVSRLLSYLFTLALVIGAFLVSVIVGFGDLIRTYLQDIFQLEGRLFYFILGQKALLAILGVFLILFLIYHYVPNVRWAPVYALPGAVLSTLGFIAVSQLFTLYIAFSKGANSNTAIGVFVLLLIWLYFNGIVFAMGASLNVLYHDYDTKSYRQLQEMSYRPRTYNASSEHYGPIHLKEALSGELQVTQVKKPSKGENK